MLGLKSRAYLNGDFHGLIWALKAEAELLQFQDQSEKTGL